MKIIHISDIHISIKKVYETVDTNKLFLDAINHINQLTYHIDFVLISGDLVQNGSVEEYLILKDILKQLKVPYFLLIGNHDDRENLKKVFFKLDYYEDDFCNFCLDNFPLKIIGLDSTTKNETHGTLCKNRLNWLEKELNKDSNKPTLIFLHHPPIPLGIKEMDKVNLKNGIQEFENIVNKNSQVKAIGCGHIHRSSFTLWNNTSVISVASTAHQMYLDFELNKPTSFILQPPSIHIISWDENIGLTFHVDNIGKFDGPYKCS